MLFTDITEKIIEDFLNEYSCCKLIHCLYRKAEMEAKRKKEEEDRKKREVEEKKQQVDRPL